MSKKYEYQHTYNPEMLVGQNYKIPVMPAEFKLANAYVPYQVMCKVYEPANALLKGTIFPELYDPYVKQEKSPKCKD